MPPRANAALPDGAEPVITLRNVTRRFAAFTAVDDVSMDIVRGEVFGLIGHNGAGKSTLFKMMLGLLAVSSGDIRISGAPVAGSGARAVRRHIGYLPENVALWDNLTGLETLHFFARLKRIDTAECQPLLERVGLGHAGKRPVRAYSKGMRQRLGFAQALLGKPQVLFLDEPTTGLDPHAIHFFWDTLAELRDQGLTIVLTSHILAELQNRVDRVAVLTNGKVQALGSVEALRDMHDLPIIVQLQLSPQMAPAQRDALLASLPPQLAALPVERQANGLQFSVPRASKLPLLQQVMAWNGAVQDIQVSEPSLEDMFFGKSQAPVRQTAATGREA